MVTGKCSADRGEGFQPLRREAILAALCQGTMDPGAEVQEQDALATGNKGKMPSPRTHGQTSLPVPPAFCPKSVAPKLDETEPQRKFCFFLLTTSRADDLIGVL